MSTAFGWPGISPTFSAGDKDTVLTALGSGRVWATVGGGVLNEVFWPHTGRPQLRDLGFLVSGPGWWVEVKREASYSVVAASPGVPLVTVTHTHPHFQLTLEFLCDPQRDVVLISYHLAASPDSIIGNAELRLHLLAAPHVGGSGHDNDAWVEADSLHAARDHEALAILADSPLRLSSAGFVGASDGWQDIAQHGEPIWQFDEARGGNVALTATLGERSGVIAIGFSTHSRAAEGLARAALIEGFFPIRAAYLTSWRDWQTSLVLPPQAPEELTALARQSASVIRVHEDQTFPGAIVASLATPWGAAHDDAGGYHLVWPRDCAEAGLALAALGCHDDARRMLDFLAATQFADGHWAQNFSPEGIPYWTGVQLDETALPLILAAKLHELDQLDEPLRQRLRPMVERACRFLVRNGPLTPQDRWEEAPGANAFTLAALVAALAAIGSSGWFDSEESAVLLSLADWWNHRIEALLYVSGTDLDGRYATSGHYCRVTSGTGPDRPDGPRGRLVIANRNGQTVDVSELVGLEFLALVRYGLRAAEDPRVLDTVRVVDAELRAPDSLLFHRYQYDGYGEHADGAAFDGSGIGRLWPLLAGERGSYAHEAGADAVPYLEAMLQCTTAGGMLPEQVWDADPVPLLRLSPGRPSGSAAPLVWAHAEFVKLYLLVFAGCRADRLDRVADRYRQPVVPKVAHIRDETDLVVPSSLVSVEAAEPFTLRWGSDGWQHIVEKQSSAVPFGLHAVQLSGADLAGRTTIEWTRRFGDRWENVDHLIRLRIDTVAR